MRELQFSEARPVSGGQTITAPSGQSPQRPRSLRRPGWLHRVFGLKQDRREARHRPCFVQASLMLRESAITLKGAVMGIHVNGVLFRQGASYLVDRAGAVVTINFAGYEILGKVTDVSERGYSVDFFESLSALDVDAILALQAPLPLNSL
jgi:hypothetical protein